MTDHVDDGQSPGVLRPLARRWEAAGRRLAGDVGLDPHSVLDPVAEQPAVEAVVGRDLVTYTEPTARATSAAFTHVAAITGRPAARAGLAAAGSAFGRLAHLLDAVEDEAGDRRAGRFNPLSASATSRPDARALAEGTVIVLRDGLAAAGLAGASLASRLLVHEAGHAVRRAFDDDHHGGRAGPLGCQLLPCAQCAEVPQPGRRRRRRRGDDGGGDGGSWCDGCTCCVCCCPCDCCDCCDACEC